MNRRSFLKNLSIAPVAVAVTTATCLSEVAEASDPTPMGYAIEVDPLIARTCPDVLFDEHGRPRRFQIETGMMAVVPGKVIPMYITGKVVAVGHSGA